MVHAAPVGAVTRGTTNPNRLRRADRWLAGPQAWRLRHGAAPPVVVDLGYGASGVTAYELLVRLRTVRPDLEVVALEVSPERVRAAQRWAEPGLTFALGGFEIPIADGRDATVVRAFNVLRQYPEDQVAGAWARVRSRLTPVGLLVDGTSDEIGRLATWVAIDRAGPVSLTLAWRLRGLDRPSVIAERLPKALIHRNVPGEPVHRLLLALDRAWDVAAPHASYGVRQRFIATVQGLADAGVPVVGGRTRWRLGELTVPWGVVAPRDGPLRRHQGP